METPAVVLGANYYTALGGIRSLGRHGVKVYALDYDFSRAYGLASRYVYRKVLCPDINRDEAAVAEFLLRLGKEFVRPPVLIASADNYAILISRYYRFPDNPSGLLEAVIDKKTLYRLSREHGLRMPLTFFPDSPAADAEAAASMRYPCIVKPALSHQFVKIFRTKCLVTNSASELMRALKTARGTGLEVMVQEIVPGFDDRMYVFDVYINGNGYPTHTLTAQKLRQFPVNFGSSTLTHHWHDEEMVETGLEFMRRLGYRGYGEIEFKRHPDTEELYMIEINARLSSINALFDACGVEFTYAMYRDLIGDPLPDCHLQEDRPVAFWHLYEDILAVRGYRRSKQLTWKEILQPWFAHRKVHAVWAADDPRPILAFAGMIFGKAVAKIRRLLGARRRAVPPAGGKTAG